MRRRSPLAGLWRATQAALLAVALLVVSAPPASAHAVGGTEPSNYRTTIHAITPQPPGLEVAVIEASSRLQLVNHGEEPVVVLGYSDEPYLRVGPGGVEENRRSPSLYSNRSKEGAPIPGNADAKAKPEWVHVSDDPTVAWHDHRTHWMEPQDPPAVVEAPDTEHVITPKWVVKLQQGDQTIEVTGDLRWVPGVSSGPWFGLAAALAVVVLAAGFSPAWVPALSVALLLLAGVDIAHTVSTWVGTSTSITAKAFGTAVSAAGWVVAVVAVLQLRRARAESGLFYLLFSAALLAVIGGLGDMASLSRSQLVGVMPALAIRAAVAAKIGLGLGLVLAGLIQLRRATVVATLAAQEQAAVEDQETAPGST